MIGKLLGHSQVQTTARYAHLANNPIKSAADRIAERISVSASGTEAPQHDRPSQHSSSEDCSQRYIRYQDDLAASVEDT